MSNDYCEKHEWPAGMGMPCPDCAELAALQATLKEQESISADYLQVCKQRDVALLQLSDAVRLLRETAELYREYGLICNVPGGLNGYPAYEGSIGQGEWICAVRDFLRGLEKPSCEMCKGSLTRGGQPCPMCCAGKRTDEFCAACGCRTLSCICKRPDPSPKKCEHKPVPGPYMGNGNASTVCEACGEVLIR